MSTRVSPFYVPNLYAAYFNLRGKNKSSNTLYYGLKQNLCAEPQATRSRNGLLWWQRDTDSAATASLCPIMPLVHHWLFINCRFDVTADGDLVIPPILGRFTCTKCRHPSTTVFFQSVTDQFLCKYTGSPRELLLWISNRNF